MERLRRLEQLLREAGAVTFGVARAERVAEEEWSRFSAWLGKGFHAGMDYMERHADIRRDPRLLLEGAKSIVSIAYNYRQPNPYRGLATYALGRDYHKVLRRRLKPVVREMKENFGGEWRICIDSAPIFERYWALKAGIGYRSPVHGNVVVPGTGSMVFLAELITTLELPPSAAAAPPAQPLPQPYRCPTGALKADGTIDCHRCINYLTIEHAAPLTPSEREMTGEAFFGCDSCQKDCPENLGPYPGVIPEFLPLEGLEEFLRGEGGRFALPESPMARRFRK